MTDKMREEFEEKFPNNAGFIFDGDTYVLPSGPTDSSLAIYCLEYRSAWRAWQSAKSVPVVGEPVAWACPFHAGEAVVNQTPCMLIGERNVNDYAKERGFPLIVQPTHSITAAELERLRKCESVLVHVRSVLPMDIWADDCRRMIDAAIAAEGE